MTTTLNRLAAAGHIPAVPTRCQLWAGVGYMVHRMLFRPGSVGVADAPVRDSRRARWLVYRPVRFFFLAYARVINPFDLLGFSSSEAYIARHVAGTYHPGDNAGYDLTVLSTYPGALEALRARVAAIVDGTAPDAELFRDLCVYAGYHERLLGLVDRAIAGEFASEGVPSDATVAGFIGWMLAQPATARGWAASR
jgi:hypothetical protein